MNSRPQISNHLQLAEHIRLLTHHAAKNGTRAVIVLEAPPLDWLATFADHNDFDYVHVESATDRSDRIGSLLGSERLRAAIQLGNTPDHGLLAALAGTVQAGGVLLIGTATLSETAQYDESRPHTTRPQTQSYATQRLIRIANLCVRAFPQQALCAHVDTTRSTLDSHRSNASDQDRANVHVNGSAPYLNPHAMAEQASLLDKACRHLDAHARTSLVISGRRGRGKSTLLARIAEQLQHNDEAFRITAMHASALRSYRQHSESLASHYVSPESISTQPIDTLFIDEASSFPLHRLRSYMERCQRLVICTTVEGYESSGRAFEIRLLPELAEIHPSLLQLAPVEPWRWANHDPLEKFTDDLLLAKNSLSTSKTRVTPHHLPGHPLQHCRVVPISQRELACNESLLAQVQTLLSTTHYQSSAKDLEHLLDAPSVQLWTQQLGPDVIAVLLVECEGCIDAALHEPILQKKRRLPNQLLPQLLAQTANTGDALSCRYARVLRIAVQPELRRKRIAASLLDAVSQQLASTCQANEGHQEASGINAIGASFAADESSLAFWDSQGYTEFHRGYRANPRTGKRAVAVLKSLDATTRAVLATAADIHQANEKARQSGKEDLRSDVTGTLEEQDVALLIRFTNGQRSALDTCAALYRLSQTISLPLSRKNEQSQRSYELELRRAVKRWLTQDKR